tara:strand:- start:413 stop:547 length:135 start_codon:yes stop_codon:yes gene_type:complete
VFVRGLVGVDDAEEVHAAAAPFPIEHRWQAMDDDVHETAKNEAE